MTWIRLGKILGILAALVIVVVVALGNSPLRTPLIAIGALALLVGGGNYLNQYLGVNRKAQEFNRPDKTSSEHDQP
ncbi:MAG: hypothetical protein WCI12_00695 [Actinomycetes bacterium]